MSLARDFARDGYVVVPGALSRARATELAQAAQALAEVEAARAPLSIFTTDVDHQRVDEWFLDSGHTVRAFFEEDALRGGQLDRPPAKAVNKIGHALHVLDPVFGPFFQDPAWRKLLIDLGLPDPRPVQSMLIYKPPEVGGVVRWHQDETYLRASPGPLIGLWWALEDADAHNGALRVAPGQHREPPRIAFRRQGQRTWHETLDERPLRLDDARTLEVEAGTLIAFHGRLPHASEPNRSPRSRVAATLHSVDRQAVWAADNWIAASWPD